MMIPENISYHLSQMTLPDPASHKGQNGKLMIIGGSELFHAASKWSLDVASKFVDMVFYSSVAFNNELVREAKSNFWNGIVVPREEIDSYVQEADCILIGPGMERIAKTTDLVNDLLQRYQHKKWVIDAGALQMMNPHLLNQNCIITPHSIELRRLISKLDEPDEVLTQIEEFTFPLKATDIDLLRRLQLILHSPTIILKGPVDYVFSPSRITEVEGGNAGMTKGGTGDVLAGLVAALYCTQHIEVAAVVGSFVNKKAGDALYAQVGPFFNASDLVEMVPQVLWQLLRKS